MQFLIHNADELNAIEEPTRTKIYELAENTGHGFELVNSSKERVDNLYDELIGGEIRLSEKVAEEETCNHYDYMETVVVSKGGGLTVAGIGVNSQTGSIKIVCVKCQEAYDVEN